MARINTPTEKPTTHEGGTAQKVSPYLELKRTVLTCMLWEKTFYESGESIADRIKALVPIVDPGQVAGLAIQARKEMYLRHVPLLLIRELARIKGNGSLVEATLPVIIQRADELAEFMAIYWMDGKTPIANGIKRGLAEAFGKFDAYQLAKYNRPGTIRLRDILFLTHPKPSDSAQQELWNQLVEDKLPVPDTWESNLGAGKDKKETFTRLLQEKKLGGLAVLRNLRLMLKEGVDEKLITDRLLDGIKKALPFRFITAAKYAPNLERQIEEAMMKAASHLPSVDGRTGLLIDVSGSMHGTVSAKSEVTCMDAACGLAIHLSEKCIELRVATFSNRCMVVPPRRGFGLRDAIVNSQPHGGTYLTEALEKLHGDHGWANLERVIVITDEQSRDGSRAGWAPKSYVINVAPYKYGVSYGNAWTHIDGWSERVVDYMLAFEGLAAEQI